MVNMRDAANSTIRPKSPAEARSDDLASAPHPVRFAPLPLPYTPIVALTVSLQGPGSPRELTQRRR
jgi:hypothetical protein